MAELPELGEPVVTLLVPYYNETDYLAATLDSLAEQDDDRFVTVLIDNGSTDGSEAIAERFRDQQAGRRPVILLSQPVPGKVPALQTGIAAVETPFFATLDADTIYPPSYVRRIIALFERADAPACVLAFGTSMSAPRWELAKVDLFSRIIPRKCHTGGYGQAFRREAFEQAGGFDSVRWPYVLEDHEIIHRLAAIGPLAYSCDHVCYPSDRRTDRTDCSWTLGERIAYKLLPGWAMDWFFYSLLADRFRKRGLDNRRLRQKTWVEES